MRPVSREEVEAAKTPGGAWARATLADWGVPWPPPKGWRRRLQRGESGGQGQPCVIQLRSGIIDDELLEHDRQTPVTIAFLMARDVVPMREAIARLFGLERRQQLVRQGGANGSAFAWSANVEVVEVEGQGRAGA